MLFTTVAFLAGIGLVVIESTFMRSVGIFGIRPDLAILVVVIATCRLNFGRVMALAFALGLTRDFFSGGLVGMNSFSLVLMAYVLIAAEDYFLTGNWKAQVFVAFLGSLIFGTLFAVLKILVGYEVTSPLRAVEIIVGTAAYTSALAPLGFAISKRPEVPSYMRLRKKYDAEHETLHPSEV